MGHRASCEQIADVVVAAQLYFVTRANSLPMHDQAVALQPRALLQLHLARDRYNLDTLLLERGARLGQHIFELPVGGKLTPFDVFDWWR